MKITFFVLLTLIIVSCDPAATTYLRTVYKDQEEKKILELRDIVVSELKNQTFEITAKTDDKNCALFMRTRRQSSYPNAVFTTYVKVCTSQSELRVRFSDYPRLTISSETQELRERIAQELKRKAGIANVVIE